KLYHARLDLQGSARRHRFWRFGRIAAGRVESDTLLSAYESSCFCLAPVDSAACLGAAGLLPCRDSRGRPFFHARTRETIAGLCATRERAEARARRRFCHL